MAVYKATYCQPYLNAVDPEALLAEVGTSSTAPFVALSCRIDTSNKNVTGYSITVWDSDNNVVFPSANADQGRLISPISELVGASGVNGTVLEIPFFQVASYKEVTSYNAVYGSGSVGSSFWVDANGNRISFSVDGRMYKWAVTLYQGDVPYKTGNLVGGESVYYMDYSSLNSYWYDMRMSSGTILGSTSKRIQLGLESAADGSFSIPDSGIVLQGRYLQLYTKPDVGSQLGVRAYVESYDSAYGHAYPAASWSAKNTQDVVESASYASFFKYSNDPDYVTASEEVDYATTSDWGEGSSVMQRGGATYVDGHQVGEGDWVLVKDQPSSTAQLNGIWIVHTTAAWERVASYDTWAEMIGKVIYVKTGGAVNGGRNFQSQAVAGGTLLTKFSQLYSASSSTYQNSYMASISSSDLPSFNPGDAAVGDIVLLLGTYNIFPINYPNQIMRCQRVATAQTDGSYWATDGWVAIASDAGDALTYQITKGYYSGVSSTVDASFNYIPVYFVASGSSSSVSPIRGVFSYSAYSRLYFTAEQPITLFSDVTTAVADYLLASAPSNSSTSASFDLDGYSLSDLRNGQTALCAADGHVYTASVSNGYASWSKGSTQYDLQNGVFLINLGIAFGARDWTAVSVSGGVVSATQSSGAQMAQVLHNSLTETYVSPYMGMLKGMRIAFTNPPSSFAATNRGSKYLPIESVDTTIWRITHPALTAPLNSAPINGGTVDPTAPYKYDVLSFFQRSDENGFYAYTTPTLTLTDLNSTDSNGSGPSSTAWTVVARRLVVQGVYYQAQKASWESYEFQLLDSNRSVLQDTGKKYDSLMMTTFYGLERNGSYSVVLTVTDSLGNVISATQTFSVVYEGVVYDGIPFSVLSECQPQCVRLDYEDTGLVLPSVELSTNAQFYEYVYSASNKSVLNKDAYARYDGTVGYFSSISASSPIGSSMTIEAYGDGIPANTIAVAPVHVWDYWRTVSSWSDAVSKDKTFLSYPIRFGLRYRSYFSANALSVTSGSYLLSLEDSDGGSADEVSFQTQLQIGPDCCGRMLRLDFSPYSKGVSSKSFSLDLSLPDNLQENQDAPRNMPDGGTDYFIPDPARAKILARLTQSGANQASNYLFVPGSTSAYDWLLPSGEPSNSYYYLQFTDEITSDASMEFLHFPRLTTQIAQGEYTDFGIPYYVKTGVLSAQTPKYPIGNMGFVTAAEAVSSGYHGCCDVNPGNGTGSPSFRYVGQSDLASFMPFSTNVGMNTIEEMLPYSYLFGSGSEAVDPTQYALDVYAGDAWDVVELYPQARHRFSQWAPLGSPSNVTVTVRGKGLDALISSLPSFVKTRATDSGTGTAGIVFYDVDGSDNPVGDYVSATIDISNE